MWEADPPNSEEAKEVKAVRLKEIEDRLAMNRMAYKEAEALGADPGAPVMQEARLLLEELQLEATVREAEAAGGPAEEAELRAMQHDAALTAALSAAGNTGSAVTPSSHPSLFTPLSSHPRYLHASELRAAADRVTPQTLEPCSQSVSQSVSLSAATRTLVVAAGAPL